MRYIILVLILICSLGVAAQNPSNYQKRKVYERIEGGLMIDSTFHLPRYNGTPTGIRTGASTHAGALAIDTANMRLYMWGDYVWTRLARYDELATASRFGVEDIRATAHRTFYGDNNTYSFSFDSMNTFGVYRNGINRIFMNSSSSGLSSPDGLNSVQVTDAVTSIGFNNSNNYLWVLDDSLIAHKRISYQGNIHGTFFPYSLVDKSYVDSAISAGGATPDLQAVTDEGNETTNDIYVNNVAGRVQVYNGSDNAYATIGTNDAFYMPGGRGGYLNLSNASGNSTYLVSMAGGGGEYIFIPASTGDTLAKLSDVRAGGGGSGTVTSFSFTDANGFVGSVTNSTTTPILTLNNNDVNWQPWYTQYLVMTGANTGSNVYYFTSSGTGTSITNLQTVPDNWMHGQQLSTGTTNSGLVYYYASAIGGSAYGAIAINSSYRYNWGQKVRFEDLSDVTETYSYYAGFLDDVTGIANVVDGAGFRYAYTDSSGKWIMWTRSNSSVTESTTSTTVAADTDYELEVTIYGGTASFYINKTLAGTISTNIPSGTSRLTTTGTVFRKSAGTTARLAYVEWMAYGKRNN